MGDYLCMFMCIYVYLCVYIVMGDYLCLFLINVENCGHIFSFMLKGRKKTNKIFIFIII